MPILSCFTPCGMLETSAEDPLAMRIYHSLAASLGPEGLNYDLTPGTRQEATVYAQAMAMAEAELLLQHAGLQMVPGYVDEMMADREREYGIVPGPNDNLITRNAVFAARKLLPRGARREAIEDALATILGNNYVGYRTTKPAERVTWPTALGDQPQNLQAAAVSRKLVRLSWGISTNLGMNQLAKYHPISPFDANLLVDDEVVIEPEILGRAEVVTVTLAPETGFFRAVFNNAHEPGCLATTAPFPMWTSNQREALIVVKSVVAIDPETRRKVNEQMERAARTVSTWCVVEETDANTAGPFLIGESPLGACPLGIVTLPPLP